MATDQTIREELILQKLDHVCRRVDEGFAQVDRRFERNEEQHADIYKQVNDSRIAAASFEQHTHAHCEDCVKNAQDIKTLGDKISLRDKIALIIIGTTGLLKAIFWWKQ